MNHNTSDNFFETQSPSHQTPSEARPSAQTGHWTFLSNHAHVLIYLADHPEARLREAAEAVGITERAVQMIVADLVAGGALERTRMGRRNRYQVLENLHLRHPIESHCKVGDLVAMIRRGG